MSKKPDILERLRERATELRKHESQADFIAGTALSSLLSDAIEEIEFLRSHAGAVTRGESFDDIAKRQGRQVVGDDPATE